MSNLIVQVRKIDRIRPHSNPSKTRIEIAEVDGWQCIVPVGQYAVGDKIVYFPPDTVLPTELTDRLGVTQYTSRGRIKTIKIDKEMSFGLIARPEVDWPVGTDVAEYYKAVKYEPPPQMRSTSPGTPGKPRRVIEGFHKFTDIENIRHFAHALVGKDIVATEKLHGANHRVAWINDEIVVGSRNTLREPPFDIYPTNARNILHKCYLWAYRQIVGKPHMTKKVNKNKWNTDWYYHVFDGSNTYGDIEGLLRYLAAFGAKNPTIYGETLGPSVQNMGYGFSETKLGYRAFDISIDGKYLSYDEFMDACRKFNIPTAPLLYRGPYDFAVLQHHATGNSTLPGANHIREGIVVKPVTETVGPGGRLIFKLINNDYLLKKEDGKVTDSTDV